MDGTILRNESAAEWAEKQFGQVDLGDRRRLRRAVQVAEAMAAHPAGSIPEQCGDWAATKGAYRFFAQEEVTLEALQQQHWQQVRQRAGDYPRILMIQDGSELEFTPHRHTQGLGPIGDGGGAGLMLHSALAVAPSGGPGGAAEVLGLAHQQIYRRRQVPPGETRTQRKARQKKARVWTETVEAVGAPPSGSLWVHVCDREADNFEFFSACRAGGAGWLVRAYQNRRAALGHEAAEPAGYLMDLARLLEPIGTRELHVRRRPQRTPRQTRLQVAAGRVTLFPSWLSQGSAEPIRCWVVRVWEPAPPQGEAGIEWVLLCSEPADAADAALRQAEWYSLRWLIEEYMKCLKTGCRVESRQMQTAGRLEAVVGVLAVVATRLLQLKQHVRVAPDAPARSCVSARHVEVLAAWYNLPVEGMTIRTFWRRVAQLGGFLCRKSDGEPGWQTLWRGWQKLDLMTIGADLARG